MKRFVLSLTALALTIALVFSSWTQAQTPPAKSVKKSSATLGEVLRLSTRDELRRGVIQRPALFLDVTGSKKNLQVALVIDGTDSMDVELDSVRKNLAAFVRGLKAKKGDESSTSFAVVIYRDQDAPSGVVAMPVDRFTDNDELLAKSLNSVKAETGAPYFNERIDAGVQAALTKLNWAPRDQDAEYTRWIVVCGDAPPYPKSKQEFTVETLTQQAKLQGVEIHTILCNSGFLKPELNQTKLLATAEKMRSSSTDFLQTLAENTGGNFLDLWDQETIKALYHQYEQVPRITRRMEAITDRDVQTYRGEQQELAKRAGKKAPVGPANLTLAVLPAAPLKEMTFKSTSDAVQTATELRERFRSLPGLNVKSSSDVEAAFKHSLAGTSEPTATATAKAVKAVGQDLEADYVIWGRLEESGNDVALTTQLYSTLDGSLIAQARRTAKKSDKRQLQDLNKDAAESLRLEAVEKLQNDAAKTSLQAVDYDPGVAREFNREFSENYDAQQAILAGLDLLERSVAFLKDEDNAETTRLLEESEGQLKTALRLDPENAFAHLLLANCYYNLSRMADVDDYTIGKYRHLRLAHKYGQSLPADSPLRREIEADHALLASKDYQAAIQHYEALANPQEVSQGRFALRANWMLAGLYLGDWGLNEVEPKMVDLNKARQAILNVLAYWPESPEAAFYQKCIAEAEAGFMQVEVSPEAPVRP